MNHFEVSSRPIDAIAGTKSTNSREKPRIRYCAAMLLSLLAITACGGGGSGGGNDGGGATSYTVSTDGGANGSISPLSLNVNDGGQADIIVTPDAGYEIDAVNGCDGSLTGRTKYTTGAITANCTVTASFILITRNLSAKSLDIINLDPRIGYPLNLSVSIEAVEQATDVGLAFFIVDKDRPNPRQLAIGSSVVAQITPGLNIYEVELDIPSSVEIAGPYFVGAIVDTADAIAETSEDDNETSTEMTLSLDPVPNLFIEDMEADRFAIELQEFGAFVQPTQLDVYNSDAGGTLIMGVKGTEVPIDVETYATLRLTRTAPTGAIRNDQFRGAITIEPTPAGADTSNSHDVPLYLWNPDTERYTNAYGVDTTTTDDPCGQFDICSGPTLPIEWLPVGSLGEMVVPGINGSEAVELTEFDRRSAHLDFYFPGKLALEIGNYARGNFILLSQPTQPPPDLSAQDIRELRDFMPYGLPDEVTAAFCVKIRPSDSTIIEDSADDNEFCEPVALLLPALPPLPPVPVIPPTPPQYSTPANPVLFEQLYKNAWGGSYFGFGIDFSAKASADNRGVIISAQGALPVQVFGQNIELIKLDGRAQVLPLSDRDKPPSGQAPGFSIELSHQQVILFSESLTSGSTGPIQPENLSYSKEVAGIERTITVGPVPVKVAASLTGNFGLEYQINLNQDLTAVLDQTGFGSFLDNDPESGDGLSLIIAPFANAEASASAAATIFIGSAGVEGALTLLEEKINIVSGASINVDDSRHIDGTTSEIVIVPRLRVINELTGARGALNLFVEVTVPTVVKCSWGFVTLVCPGLSTSKYPFNIANYTAWKKVDVLLDISSTIDIVTLGDGTVNYYQ